MGKDKINRNLFIEAIEKNEIDKFILGVGEYFIQGPEIEGHWVLGSYNRHVRPFLEYSEVLPDPFWTDVIRSLKSSDDKNLYADFLISFLIPYYSNEK